MNVERQVVGEVTVVSISEPIEMDTANAEAFKEAVLAAVGDAEKVVLDVSLVEFFDSAGMGALLSVQKDLGGRKGTVVLAGLNRAVLEVFQMVGFDSIFQIHPDVPSAVASLEEAS